MSKNYDFFHQLIVIIKPNINMLLHICYYIKWIVLFQFQKFNVESYIGDNMLENHHNPKHMERTAKNY